MEIRPIFSSLLRNKTGALLIAAQVALSLAIVANALYIIKERLQLVSRESGVAAESEVFHIAVIPLKEYETAAEMAAARKRTGDLIRAVPGVASVAGTNTTPLSSSGWNTGVGLKPDQTESTAYSALYFGGDSLVKTLGLKLVEGRDFTADEIQDVDPDSSRDMGRVAIMTKNLADEMFPGTSAVGKIFYLGGNPDAEPHRVVGVVEKLQTPWAHAGERGERATILGMNMLGSFSRYVVRAEPGQLDRVMKDVEMTIGRVPGLMVVDQTALSEDRFDLYRDDRAVAWMLTTVTVLLLLVTASGIVGMATLWVNQRRKQIGVRRALGARKLDILRYFITENFIITTGGVVAGLLLAVGLNQLLVSQLELSKLPLGYLAVGSLVLWLVGIAAVYAPAWRASGISPAIATRSA
jgi:putative ABC transport system permease protein